MRYCVDFITMFWVYIAHSEWIYQDFHNVEHCPQPVSTKKLNTSTTKQSHVAGFDWAMSDVVLHVGTQQVNLTHRCKWLMDKGTSNFNFLHLLQFWNYNHSLYNHNRHNQAEIHKKARFIFTWYSPKASHKISGDFLQNA